MAELKTVKEIRQESQLTQRFVSEQSHVPYSTYLKKESGMRRWYIDELMRVCKVLGCNVYDIKELN